MAGGGVGVSLAVGVSEASTAAAGIFCADETAMMRKMAAKRAVRKKRWGMINSLDD